MTQSIRISLGPAKRNTVGKRCGYGFCGDECGNGCGYGYGYGYGHGYGYGPYDSYGPYGLLGYGPFGGPYGRFLHGGPFPYY